MPMTRYNTLIPGTQILAHGEVIRDVCQVWPGLKLWLENKVEITLLPRAGLTGSGGLAWVAGHDGHTPPHVQSHHLMRASIATSFNYHQRHWSWCDHVTTMSPGHTDTLANIHTHLAQVTAPCFLCPEQSCVCDPIPFNFTSSL